MFSDTKRQKIKDKRQKTKDKRQKTKDKDFKNEFYLFKNLMDAIRDFKIFHFHFTFHF